MFIHAGSTRDWVKHYGTESDSLRYRLEFLDSKTTLHQRSAQISFSRFANGDMVQVSSPATFFDTAIDWRVRITSPGNPSFLDSAVLRVHSGAAKCESPDAPVDQYRFEKIAYWRKPSADFPIDLFTNPPEQVQRISYYGISYDTLYAFTGSGELAAVNDRMKQKIRIEYLDGILRYIQLWEGFIHSVPAITVEYGVGISSWMAHGNLWTLDSSNGTPIPQARRGLGHVLKKGESWVYRDSSMVTFANPDSVHGSLISLELLETPTDSAGWLSLKVRETTAPDTGNPTDSILEIRLDTLQRMVRVLKGSKLSFGTPWSMPSTMEGRWALGLLTHPLFSDSANLRYWEVSGKTQGEIPSSTTRDTFEMRMHKDIGSTWILKKNTHSSYAIFNGFSTWTLVAHALDNTILPASAKTPHTVRNLAWLRARIAQDPALEVVRIRLDGVRAKARGAKALELLDARGIGFVQVRDGQDLVTLRVVRP